MFGWHGAPSDTLRGGSDAAGFRDLPARATQRHQNRLQPRSGSPPLQSVSPWASRELESRGHYTAVGTAAGAGGRQLGAGGGRQRVNGRAPVPRRTRALTPSRVRRGERNVVASRGRTGASGREAAAGAAGRASDGKRPADPTWAGRPVPGIPAAEKHAELALYSEHERSKQNISTAAWRVQACINEITFQGDDPLTALEDVRCRRRVADMVGSLTESATSACEAVGAVEAQLERMTSRLQIALRSVATAHRSDSHAPSLGDMEQGGDGSPAGGAEAEPLPPEELAGDVQRAQAAAGDQLLTVFRRVLDVAREGARMGKVAGEQVASLQQQLAEAEAGAGPGGAARDRDAEASARRQQQARDAAHEKEVAELQAAVAARDERLCDATKEADGQRAHIEALERRLAQAPRSSGQPKGAESEAEVARLRGCLSDAEAARDRAVQEATKCEAEASAAREAAEQARHEAQQARVEAQQNQEAVQKMKNERKERKEKGVADNQHVKSEEQASSQEGEGDAELLRLQARVEKAEEERARLMRAEAERLEYDRRMEQDEQARVFEAHKLRLCMHIQRERQRLIDLFRGLDENGDGLLSREEFRTGFDRLHLGLPHDMLDSLFQEADAAGRGHVDFSHFIATFERNFRLARTAMPTLLDVVVQEAIRAERARWRRQRDSERARWAGQKAMLELSLETTRGTLRRERSASRIRRSSATSAAKQGSRDGDTGSVSSSASVSTAARHTQGGSVQDEGADVDDWCEAEGLDPHAVAADGGTGAEGQRTAMASPSQRPPRDQRAAGGSVAAAAATVTGAARWGNRGGRRSRQRRDSAAREASGGRTPPRVAAEGEVGGGEQEVPPPTPLKDLLVHRVQGQGEENGIDEAPPDPETPRSLHAPEVEDIGGGDDDHQQQLMSPREEPQHREEGVDGAALPRSPRAPDRDKALPPGFLGSFTAAARALALQTASVTRLGAVRRVGELPFGVDEGATPGELRAQLSRLQGLCEVVLRGADRLGASADEPPSAPGPSADPEGGSGPEVVGAACIGPGGGPHTPTQRPSTAPARGSATDVVHTLRRLAQARRAGRGRGKAEPESSVSLGITATVSSASSGGAQRQRRASSSQGWLARSRSPTAGTEQSPEDSRPSMRDHALALDLRVGEAWLPPARRSPPQGSLRHSARWRAKLGRQPSFPLPTPRASLHVRGTYTHTEPPSSQGRATARAWGGRPRPGSAAPGARSRPALQQNKAPGGEPPAVIVASAAPRERDRAGDKEARVQHALSYARRQRHLRRTAGLSR